ncbi:RNA polymerase sigma factor [Pedobacter sp.]|uniref:RNA polymerase sigma factor n=1 Tax=Pedobacter sp. TaxID=1411316 RepID=UPI003D7FB176
MKDNLTPYDKDLIALCKKGDPLAFKQIYEQYWQLLYIAAFKVLKDEDEAKDVVQEVFISFIDRAGLFEIQTSIAGYLYTAVRYKVLDFISRKKIRENHVASITTFLEENTYRADHHVIEKETIAEIEREIQFLPTKMRQIFELSRKEHLTYKEIADRLNLSDKTVKKQINNALKILKPKLNAYNMIYVLIYFKLL